MKILSRRTRFTLFSMGTPRHAARAALMSAALLLAGCISIPEAIQGTTQTPHSRLTQIAMLPQDFVGQEARLGGRVVDVFNEHNRTRLEIASMPLDRWARPQLDLISEGRFVAYVNGFLEPLDFRGRLVTVVGPIVGTEKGRIGIRAYQFVVIDVKGYQRWNETQQVMLPPGASDPWGWDWRYRRGWGFANDWPGPARVETIVTP